ncbi:hypothetical protein RDJ12_07615 [Mergibacter septicus]|uniref:hypothetical protein n=1 Tax=Mergibacter septicus TaxID=221402 RepID=UPI0021C4910C|nr:hypothetical protein [Mergibacter septicus]UTU48588.1 hypothetical protein HLL31_07390 [Mergibacter septicus]WMR95783.1 hypothetical protein RDJ12_07615 [Mergibacter septicus]
MREVSTKLELDIAQVRLELHQVINKLYVAFAIGAVSIVSIILTVLPLILRQ